MSLLSIDPTTHPPPWYQIKMPRAKEPPTLVEFILEKTASGTLLVVTESGFDALPAARRTEAFRMNDGGWAEQMTNIQRHVSNAPQ